MMGGAMTLNRFGRFPGLLGFTLTVIALGGGLFF